MHLSRCLNHIFLRFIVYKKSLTRFFRTLEKLLFSISAGLHWVIASKGLIWLLFLSEKIFHSFFEKSKSPLMLYIFKHLIFNLACSLISRKNTTWFLIFIPIDRCMLLKNNASWCWLLSILTRFYLEGYFWSGYLVWRGFHNFIELCEVTGQLSLLHKTGIRITHHRHHVGTDLSQLILHLFKNLLITLNFWSRNTRSVCS